MTNLCRLGFESEFADELVSDERHLRVYANDAIVQLRDLFATLKPLLL